MPISGNFKNVLHQSKEYLMISLGLFILAFGFSAFILPEKVVTGGVTGIATLIHFATATDTYPGINVAIPNYLINVVLLLMAFRTVGKQFVIRTIYGATVFSLFLGILTPLFPHPLVEQQAFMNVLIGAVLCGMGMGLTFSYNGSSGGTDVIAAMVNKYSNVSFGRMMLYCDLCIISCSWFLFQDIGRMMFGYVFLVVNSIAADMIVNNRFQSVQYLIFSKKWKEIADAINKDADRGCTVIDGTGWYSKENVKILLTVCRKHDSMTVQRVIKTIDPNAFISVSKTGAVYGLGFDEMKVRSVKLKSLENQETEQNLQDKTTI